MSVEKRLEELTAEFNQLNGQKQGLVAQMQKIETRLIELKGAHQEVSRNIPKTGETLPKVAPKTPPVEAK